MPLPHRPLPIVLPDSGRGSLLFTILAILFFQGCAERPSSQIEAVTRSIQDARLAGAEEYAIEEFQLAEISYRKALEALGNQDKRIAWLRNYSLATRHLDMARSQADEAKTEALANLTETKFNAQTALSMARDQIGQTQNLLAQPLSTFRFNQEFEEIHSALHDAEDLLNTMESSIDSGDYIQVMTSAHVVETLALAIHQRILVLLSRSPSLKVQV